MARSLRVWLSSCMVMTGHLFGFERGGTWSNGCVTLAPA
jgi:hypothetical protein